MYLKISFFAYYIMRCYIRLWSLIMLSHYDLLRKTGMTKNISSITKLEASPTYLIVMKTQIKILYHYKFCFLIKFVRPILCSCCLV